MAYLKALYVRECGVYGCKRPATQVLCNRYNAECSWFCSRHGQHELKAMEEKEAHEPFKEVWA